MFRGASITSRPLGAALDCAAERILLRWGMGTRSAGGEMTCFYEIAYNREWV